MADTRETLSCSVMECRNPQAGEEIQQNLETMGYPRTLRCERHVDAALQELCRFWRDRKDSGRVVTDELRAASNGDWAEAQRVVKDARNELQIWKDKYWGEVYLATAEMIRLHSVIKSLGGEASEKALLALRCLQDGHSHGDKL